jgi:hypothetical protein
MNPGGQFMNTVQAPKAFPNKKHPDPLPTINNS